MSSKVWKFKIQLSGFKIKNFKFFPNIIDFKRPWVLGILLFSLFHTFCGVAYILRLDVTSIGYCHIGKITTV